MMITFGKYKGYELSDVPKEYLTWVITNVKQTSFNFYLFEEIKLLLIPQLSNDDDLRELQIELSIFENETINEFGPVIKEVLEKRIEKWNLMKDRIKELEEELEEELEPSPFVNLYNEFFNKTI